MGVVGCHGAAMFFSSGGRDHESGDGDGGTANVSTR